MNAVFSEANLVLAGFFLAVAGVIALAVFFSRRQTRHRRVLLDRLSQGLGHLEANVPLTVTREGVTFRLLYSPAGRRTELGTLSVTLATGSREAFTLKREGAADRFFKRTGMSTEIQTGDAAFDEAVYIESDSPAFVRTLLGTPERRDAVRQILDAGFTQIDQYGGELSATWYYFSPGTGTAPAVILVVARHLADLVAGEPATALAAGPVPRWRPGMRRITMVSGPIVVAVAAFLVDAFADTWFHPLDSGAVWIDSLKLGAVGLVVASVLFVKFFWGSSGAHRKLLIWSIPLLSLLSFGANGLTILLNAWLDGSVPSAHVARVESMYRGRGKSSSSYYARVDSWRAPGTLETLRVSSSDYRQLRPGIASLLVRIGAGRFGHAWIADIHRASAAEIVAVRTTEVEANPHDDRAVYERGVAYLDSGDPGRAIDDFKTAIELNPRNTDAYRYLGFTHGRRGEHPEAVAVFTALLEINPRDGYAYFMRSWNRNKLGDRAGTLADLTRACELGHKQACEVKRRATRQPN